MKKLISSLLVIVSLIMNICAKDPDVYFSDVDENDWFSVSVEYVCNNGIMDGKSGKIFSPYSFVTRSDMAIIIFNALCGTDCTYSGKTFSDIDTNAGYYPYLVWCLSFGLLNGYSDNTFKPDNYLTRQEFAVVMSNIIAYLSIDTDSFNDDGNDFSDKREIPKWVLPTVMDMKKAGLFIGDENRCFNPSVNLSRAECSVVFYRLFTSVFDQ